MWSNQFDSRANFEMSIAINKVFQLIVSIIMIFATVFAYYQTSGLDVDHRHSRPGSDDILLFVSLPAFFMESIFCLVPAVISFSVLNISIAACELIQVLIQTPLIIDGKRRCSNSKELQKRKPGRELIIFLTIANVSLWIFETFSIKTIYTDNER